MPSAGETLDLDRSAIRTAFQEWLNAAESGDAEAYVGFFTEDAVVLSPGQPEVEGRPSILAAVRAFLSVNRLTFADWQSKELAIFGNAAIHRYTIVTTRHPDGGDGVAQEQRYLDVLRHDPDGCWRVSHHMFNLGK